MGVQRHWILFLLTHMIKMCPQISFPQREEGNKVSHRLKYAFKKRIYTPIKILILEEYHFLYIENTEKAEPEGKEDFDDKGRPGLVPLSITLIK